MEVQGYFCNKKNGCSGVFFVFCFVLFGVCGCERKVNVSDRRLSKHFR